LAGDGSILIRHKHVRSPLFSPWKLYGKGAAVEGDREPRVVDRGLPGTALRVDISKLRNQLLFREKCGSDGQDSLLHQHRTARDHSENPESDKREVLTKGYRSTLLCWIHTQRRRIMQSGSFTVGTSSPSNARCAGTSATIIPDWQR